MNIPDNIKQKILDKKWYHQRFDGSPMFIDFIAQSEVKKEERKPAGIEPDIRVCFFEDGRADWYIDMDDIKRGAGVVVELAKNDPEFSTKLLAEWKEDEEKAEKFFWEEFPKFDLPALSDDELAALWQRYTIMFVSRFTSSTIIDHFALGTDLLINNMLQEEVGEVKKKSDFTEIFSTATAPITQSFINKAEIDLLKIATGKSDETLSDYQKRYFWTKNNYVVTQKLSVEHFQEEIQAWKKSDRDLNKVLAQIESTPAQNKHKKEELFKKYNFSQHLRTLLEISEDFTWWQDERKKATYYNIHIGSQFLAELARRVDYVVEPRMRS